MLSEERGLIATNQTLQSFWIEKLWTISDEFYDEKTHKRDRNKQLRYDYCSNLIQEEQMLKLVQQWPVGPRQVGPTLITLGPLWSPWAHLDHLGPTLITLGPLWSPWSHLGSTWVPPLSPWSHLGTSLIFCQQVNGYCSVFWLNIALSMKNVSPRLGRQHFPAISFPIQFIFHDEMESIQWRRGNSCHWWFHFHWLFHFHFLFIFHNEMESR